jgi:hypothetical protein
MWRTFAAVSRCPEMADRAKREHLQWLRRQIEKLPPYPALFVLAVPLALVEPFKLVIVIFAGEGHWLTGVIGMICAYAISLFLTHWLFGVVEPKLLTIPWFARGWRWFVAQRDRALIRGAIWGSRWASRWFSRFGWTEMRRTSPRARRESTKSSATRSRPSHIRRGPGSARRSPRPG